MSEAATAAVGEPGPRLEEARRLAWREDPSPRTLRRDGHRWTAWSVWVVLVFSVPGALLLAIEPWTFPAAAICFVHAWAIPWLQARRGARHLVAIGGERSGARPPARRATFAAAPAPDARPSGAPAPAEDPESAERIALGLLGDLVGHRERGLLAETGLAVERGALGVWVIGERGALCVRPGGRRVDCWCVRVSETVELPAGDRVAHLLLALREDELGFVKVANLGFSGALRRVLPHLEPRARRAVRAARSLAR